MKAGVIYVYALLLGLIGITDWDSLPHQTRSEAGLICVPLADDFASEMVFWFVFTPAFMGLPLMFVFYVIYDVWKNNLLPPKGKRRLLGLYFFRIVVVFGAWFVCFASGRCLLVTDLLRSSCCLVLSASDHVVSRRDFFLCLSHS